LCAMIPRSVHLHLRDSTEEMNAAWIDLRLNALLIAEGTARLLRKVILAALLEM